MSYSHFTLSEAVIIEVVRVLASTDVIRSHENRKRKRSAPVNLEETVWGRMLVNPSLRVAGSFVAKQFRRRFRMPYTLFADIFVPLCVSKDIFQLKCNSRIPVEIRLLIVLRILGRGHTADDCFELSGVGESTCNALLRL